MVPVGQHPILWHIMNIYAHQGFNDFVLALGYKSDVIKQYFLNYYTLNSDFSIDLSSGEIQYDRRHRTDWKVALAETGEATMTGGRLLRLQGRLAPHGTFMLTYGDGVANVDINALVKFHKSHGKLCTVTAIQPTGRFGTVEMKGDAVASFKEKAHAGEGWINGGFFVMEPGVFKYLENDATILERSPMEKLAKDGELMAYRHSGFWQCMDTVRDRQLLEEEWNSGRAPWHSWK
jgi:glucose-1-phosphate cytidylyltransferase